MKIRTGFVSNSSSSSFVIIGTKETIDKAKNKLTPFGKEVVDYTIYKFNEMTLDGKIYLISSGEISSEDFGGELIYTKDGDWDDRKYNKAQDQWDKFLKEVNNLGGYADEN